MTRWPRSARTDVSVVVPVYNEEESLEILVPEILRSLDGYPSFEILFIDDGSTDSSPDVLDRLARQDDRIRVLRQRKNAGQSAAFGVGFKQARGDVIVTLDADLQNDPGDIPRLLNQLGSYDVVCGVRMRRKDNWLRRISSKIANRTRNWVTGDSVADVGCSLRAFRAEFGRRVPVFNGMHRFLPTLFKMDGAKIVEIPVRHRPRVHGTSKYNVRNRLWRGIVDLFGVRWLQSRWVDRTLSEELAADESDRTPRSGSGGLA